MKKVKDIIKKFDWEGIFAVTAAILVITTVYSLQRYSDLNTEKFEVEKAVIETEFFQREQHGKEEVDVFYVRLKTFNNKEYMLESYKCPNCREGDSIIYVGRTTASDNYMEFRKCLIFYKKNKSK